MNLLCYRTQHVLSVFENEPETVVPITLKRPGGTVSPEMLKICERLAEASEARLTKLDTKSTGTLSLVAVVIPVTASAVVFIRQHSLPPMVSAITLTLDVLAIAWLLLGLFAALRAFAIRGQQELYLNAVIDPATDTIRNYDADFFGRGLLYIAAHRQAMGDHIADFVRAAQLFLVLGVTCAVGAAAPVLFFVGEDTQLVRGTITVDPQSIAAIQKNIDTALVDPSVRITRLEAQIESLRREQADPRTQVELERLGREVEALRRTQDRAQPASGR
jgi:hypothetical protein